MDRQDNSTLHLDDWDEFPETAEDFNLAYDSSLPANEQEDPQESTSFRGRLNAFNNGEDDDEVLIIDELHRENERTWKEKKMELCTLGSLVRLPGRSDQLPVYSKRVAERSSNHDDEKEMCAEQNFFRGVAKSSVRGGDISHDDLFSDPEDVAPSTSRGITGRVELSDLRSHQRRSTEPASKTPSPVPDLSFSDDEMSVGSDVAIIDPEPVIRFARNEKIKAHRIKVETKLGDIWAWGPNKAFQTDEDLATVHEYLLVWEHRHQYFASTVPQEFQGAAYFAIQLDAAVMQGVGVLEIMKLDGNRTWEQGTSYRCSFMQEEELKWIFVKYYSHKGVVKFGKKISYVTYGPTSNEMDFTQTNFVVIQYYWRKGTKPTPFDPAKFRAPKIPEYIKKKLEEKFDLKSRGTLKAPRHAYAEVLRDFPESLVKLNPSFQPTNPRQASNVKQSIKRKHYGSDDLQYIINSNAVETRFISVVTKSGEKEKRKLHFICEEYQLLLMACYLFGLESVTAQIDVKFDLSNAFAVVFTLRIPGFEHRERGSTVLAAGFVALTERKEESVYEECALWLKDKMANRGVVMHFDRRKGNLKFVTDDEPGLYNPFIKHFDVSENS